jgi:hypothetical protein
MEPIEAAALVMEASTVALPSLIGFQQPGQAIETAGQAGAPMRSLISSHSSWSNFGRLGTMRLGGWASSFAGDGTFWLSDVVRLSLLELEC